MPERKPTMGEILEALRCVERIDVGKFDHPELARISVANLIAELTAAMLDGANRNG